MGKWTALLTERVAEAPMASPPNGTAKTDKREVLSVLSVGVQGAAGEIRPADASRAQPPATRTKQLTRPFKLTTIEGDAAHAERWDERACSRFVARVSLFLRRGMNATDADDLAERLHLREVQGDDRRMCVECSHLAGRASSVWRCSNAHAAGVARELPAELVTMAQRCPGFAEVG